jgi:hypothetical protein
MACVNRPLVWPLSLDLSAKGDPTSSYATDGRARRVIGVLKLLYHDKVEVTTGEIILSVNIYIGWDDAVSSGDTR